MVLYLYKNKLFVERPSGQTYLAMVTIVGGVGRAAKNNRNVPLIKRSRSFGSVTWSGKVVSSIVQPALYTSIQSISESL